jgi:3'-5' exoribonuclease
MENDLKKIFVKDLKEKQRVDTTLLVTRKLLGVSKAGKPYLALRLMDSTGELDARVWDNAESIAEGFALDDVARVKGSALSYQGKMQLNVSSIKALGEGEYTLRDYLPASKRPPEEMMAELDALIASMKDPFIKGLLLKMLPEGSELRSLFMTAPAAKMMHHPYLGGLLEHVLSLCGLGVAVSGHYKRLNRDLLLAGLMLHDIGKVYELSYSRSFGYTDEGRLIGHITMGTDLVDSFMKEIPEFPSELRMQLRHLLLSHHGTLEFGSPKRPKTLEAIVLSYLDDLDAKVNAVETLTDDPAGEENWSPYQRIFERYIYKQSYRYVDGDAGGAPEAQPATGDKPEPRSAEESGKEKTSEFDLFK